MILDELQTFLFSDDYYITPKLYVKHPTVGEIAKYGEQKYFQYLVGLFTSIPSDLKSFLFDNGIDYEAISDFELFIIISKSMSVEETNILFGDQVNFQSFVPIIAPNGMTVLYDKDNDIVIDQNMHMLFTKYLCDLHGIVKKRDIAGNEFTKKMLIDLDRSDRSIAAKKPYRPFLKPLVSAMVNSAGFKYNHKQVVDLPIAQFLDSVSRIQIISSSTALLHGAYSGFCDTSKLDKSQLNWLRDIKS